MLTKLLWCPPASKSLVRVQWMDREDPVVQWLLGSGDPSIRYFTLIDLLDEPSESYEVQEARNGISKGQRVRALLAGQEANGGFGVHPYKKWDGAHWRLVSLVDLGFPPGDPKAEAAMNQVLQWLSGRGHRERIMRINGLTRRCASQEGNALGVCSKLGLAEDERVRLLAESLTEWQWPDGGWNCDKRPEASHSSFYESLSPMWGLVEYHRATGDRESVETAEKTAELFLRHRLYRSERTGEVIDQEWLKLHYPLYWHYDILQGLRLINLLDKLGDPRTVDALDVLEGSRLADGRWRPSGYYWRKPGSKSSPADVVDWGRGGPNCMITLNALRVLKWAGRLS